MTSKAIDFFPAAVDKKVIEEGSRDSELYSCQQYRHRQGPGIKWNVGVQNCWWKQWGLCPWPHQILNETSCQIDINFWFQNYVVPSDMWLYLSVAKRRRQPDNLVMLWPFYSLWTRKYSHGMHDQIVWLASPLLHLLSMQVSHELVFPITKPTVVAKFQLVS